MMILALFANRSSFQLYLEIISLLLYLASIAINRPKLALNHGTMRQKNFQYFIHVSSLYLYILYYVI